MGENVLIIGAGHGLSAAVARRFAKAGARVGLAARTPDKISDLAQEINATAYACDATEPHQVAALFDAFDRDLGSPDVVVYNPSARARGAITEVDAAATKNALMVTAYGAFLAAQQAAKRMVKAGSGTLLFTGASAGIKGYPRSAPFAMGKFALRGLCQSLARELAPQNIHVAHFVIDGTILNEQRGAPYNDPKTSLNPDDIAETYFHVTRQNPSAWTWEIELRPSVETF